MSRRAAATELAYSAQRHRTAARDCALRCALYQCAPPMPKLKAADARRGAATRDAAAAPNSDDDDIERRRKQGCFEMEEALGREIDELQQMALSHAARIVALEHAIDRHHREMEDVDGLIRATIMFAVVALGFGFPIFGFLLTLLQFHTPLHESLIYQTRTFLKTLTLSDLVAPLQTKAAPHSPPNAPAPARAPPPSPLPRSSSPADDPVRPE